MPQKPITKKYLIAFEKKIADMFRAKKIRVPIHLSGGNEDELIRIFKKIERNDYVFSSHRNHYHYLLHGGNPIKLIDSILHSPMGSMHIIDPPKRFYSTAIVGGAVAIAAGVALAIKMQKMDIHVWCFVGDAVTDGGWYWEAKHYAEANDLPITYIVEDNNRSVCSTKSQRYCYVAKWPHCGVGEFIPL